METCPPWPDRVEECRLERADGSVWTVEALELEGPRVRVTARETSGPKPSVMEDRARLEDAVLGRGDVIRWLGAGGEVLWALRVPAGDAPSSTGTDG